MSYSQDRQAAIDAGRYAGADNRRETGSTWQDVAEAGLRIVCREQRRRIAELERELAKAKRIIGRMRKRPKLEVVKQQRRAAI